MKKNISILVFLLFGFVSIASLSGNKNSKNFLDQDPRDNVSFVGETIDLTNDNLNHLIVLNSADPPGKSQRNIILPQFNAFCQIAADSNAFRWIGASNRMFPWVGKTDLTSIFVPKNPVPPRIPMPNKRALLMMFKLSNGKVLTIMPLSGDASVSWLETEDDGKLKVDYGTLGTEHVPKNEEVPLLAWAIGDNVYESISEMWRNLANSHLYKDKVSLRYKKQYPEPMKYLGWCTWEQYHKNINEGLLKTVVGNIERSDIPVRWLLIDDGHQKLKDGRMLSLKPDNSKFPNGWQPITSSKKEDKIRWMGIWHTLLIYWNDISPDHEMSDLAPYLMPKPVKDENEPTDNKYVQNAKTEVKALIPKDNGDDSEKFYDHFMKTVKDQGFDFIKTDNVSRSVIEYFGTANPARAQTFNVLSLEKACKKYDLGLMNCSAQNTIDLLNATNSATMRTSPDYQKGNLETSKSQILQSVFNTLWIGQTLWPDDDMFHSSDSQVAETMAVTKVMSGGPVYLSDAPEDFNKDIIMPLCYNDGLLIRPIAPGVPLPESLFNDALYEKDKLYRIVAPLNNNSCAIVTYNLTIDNQLTLRGKITSDDYQYGPIMVQPFKGLWKKPDEGLVIYDWKEQRGSKLNANGFKVSIKGFGHRLFILSPIIKGWAAIGRPDKYLSSATVDVVKITKREIVLKMFEPGTIILYSEEGNLKSDQLEFTSLDNGLYRGTFKENSPHAYVITIARD